MLKRNLVLVTQRRAEANQRHHRPLLRRFFFVIPHDADTDTVRIAPDTMSASHVNRPPNDNLVCAAQLLNQVMVRDILIAALRDMVLPYPVNREFNRRNAVVDDNVLPRNHFLSHALHLGFFQSLSHSLL
jgi:hypothetical protein